MVSKRTLFAIAIVALGVALAESAARADEIGGSWSGTIGNEYAGVTGSAHGSASNNISPRMSTGATLDVHFLQETRPGFEAYAGAYNGTAYRRSLGGDGEVAAYLKLGGWTVYSQSSTSSLVLSKTFPIVSFDEAELVVMVGPVPVRLTGSAEVRLFAALTLERTATGVAAHGTIEGQAEGSASAGVGISSDYQISLVHEAGPLEIGLQAWLVVPADGAIDGYLQAYLEPVRFLLKVVARAKILFWPVTYTKVLVDYTTSGWTKRWD